MTKTYVKFENCKETVRNVDGMNIMYGTDDNGQEWYETRAKLREDSLKIYTEIGTNRVFMGMRDTSPAMPSEGTNFYECDDNGEDFWGETIYVYVPEEHRCRVDEHAMKLVQMGTVFGGAYEDAEKVIAQIRIKIDEVEYGDEEDIDTGWRNEMRAWVKYRKELKHILDNQIIDAVLPEAPETHITSKELGIQ